MPPSSSRLPPIPVDYTFSKPYFLSRSDLTVRRADGTAACTVRDASPPPTRTLHDSSSGAPLISAVQRSDGSWEGFRGGHADPRALVFTARRKPRGFTFLDEMEVFLASEGFSCSFRLSGNPSRRSCTIYRGNSVVAQSNLMYKLHKVWYSTREFRLMVYSEIDHTLAIILVAMFMWGSWSLPYYLLT